MCVVYIQPPRHKKTKNDASQQLCQERAAPASTWTVTTECDGPNAHAYDPATKSNVYQDFNHRKQCVSTNNQWLLWVSSFMEIQADVHVGNKATGGNTSVSQMYVDDSNISLEIHARYQNRAERLSRYWGFPFG